MINNKKNKTDTYIIPDKAFIRLSDVKAIVKYCDNGCNISDSSTYGYWTSTPVIDNFNYAWFVSWNNRLSHSVIGNSNPRGIRPVITISKSLIS